MTRPLRIGVLGCADIARRRMLPAFAAHPGTEPVAVASRDRARAAALAEEYGCRAVHGYAELLADDAVDAVYVPLPPALHEEWTETALRAGKHVLAEKPLTLDPVRTAALAALARERGLALMENVMFVHHPQHTAVRELVAKGAIGEPRAFHAVFTLPRRQAGDIRLRPELGGGALWDAGVYPVRAALHLLGPELRVVGATVSRGPGDAVDTAGAALARTPGGVGVQLSFGLDHAYRNFYEIWGTEGTITVDRAFTPPAGHRPVLRLTGPAGSGTVDLAPADQVAATVGAFVAAVRAGASLDADALRQAQLLEEIRHLAG
ncbi:Gfo/Idh/MocA family protein [Streptomyces hesseae]|uniref:Gfo/Idh/MocA family oxidoreductase n=1 Tax=Streptomyces hesseae TaxID=3075519 RepID=A0ABU2T109_9ACTN|nr:Gfo/Idh/MocA family oxidoreductase [Streptomyces sp. DSM 40473]MDT0453980.1 Gfo/Idh/MocA family oxidoreductase [Streptomyces sp. DSM 40473]